MTDSGLGRRFWLLWTTLATANLGDGLTLVGFPLLAVGLTDDARLVALVAAARMAPFPLIGLPAGVIIDRFDRRKLAMVAQSARSVAIVGLSIALLAGFESIALLAVVAFITGTGEVFIDSGLPAIVRAVVRPDQLEVANSRIAASVTTTNRFIGPPLGAVLFTIDPALPFIGGAVLFVAGVLLLTQLQGPFRPPPDPARDDGSLLHRITRGLSYVWSHDVLRPLALTVGVFSFAGEAGKAVHVILLTEEFGLSEIEYGLILTVDAAVAILISFGVARYVRRTSHGWSMRTSVLCFAAGTIALGLTSVTSVVIVSAVLGGISNPTWNVVSSTVRQRLVPDEIFGRMMSAYLVIAWGMQPLGALAGGLVAEAFSPSLVFVLTGATVGSILLWGNQLFVRIDRALAASE